MLCFFHEALCLPLAVAWIVGVLVGLCILLIFIIIFASVVSKAQKGSVIDSQSPEGSGQVNNDLGPGSKQEDDDFPPVKKGQRILYDTSGSHKCNLVVTEVDEHESEVTGYFEVDLPQGAEVLMLHFDRDNEEIALSFKMPGGVAEELFFNTEAPDEVDGYDVYVDYLTTTFSSPISPA